MKITRVFIGLFLLLASLVVICQPATVVAQTTEITEEVNLTATYPTLEAISGGSYEFEVTIRYIGIQPRIFNLAVSGPKGWDFYVTPSYPKDKRIKDVRIDPLQGGSETVLVEVTPAYGLQPEPGEYTVTLEAAAGNLKGSIVLKAVVTARYSLTLTTLSYAPYSTTATAGKEGTYAVVVGNSGTATVDEISFSSDKPEGWTIDFSPDKVTSLQADGFQTVDVKIKPAAKAIAGDYIVTLRASGKQATANTMDVRVTVETPTVWGWTGVVIIALVIAGLTFVIMRFSRR